MKRRRKSGIKLGIGGLAFAPPADTTLEAASGHLAAAMAHEVNNSLDTLQNCLHLLSGQVQPAGVPAYELLRTEGARLSRLVREILGLYRGPQSPASVDVNAVVTQTLRALEPRLRKVRLTTVLDKLPLVAVSHAQLRTVLSNLVLNAADAMPGGGKLRVETSVVRQHCIRLRVSDTGSGIPQELKLKMFQPFVSSKGDRGTGLGLWLVAQIVSHHGGRVRALPRAGGGTIFEVELPREIKKGKRRKEKT